MKGSTARKVTLGCGAATVLIGGLWWVSGQAVTPLSIDALPAERESTAKPGGDASSQAAAHGATEACGRAANPFAAVDGCSSAGAAATADGEPVAVRHGTPVRGEQAERELRAAEAGSASALPAYVDLRLQCVEQAHLHGPECFSNESLAMLDARFLQIAGPSAQSGHADAQLALIAWWRQRAYQLLGADPVASATQWEESEEKLVARVMGFRPFAQAMHQSRQMYDRLAANDPSKLEQTDYLKEFTRYGVVTTTPPVR